MYNSTVGIVDEELLYALLGDARVRQVQQFQLHVLDVHQGGVRYLVVTSQRQPAQLGSLLRLLVVVVAQQWVDVSGDDDPYGAAILPSGSVAASPETVPWNLTVGKKIENLSGEQRTENIV